MTSLQSHMLCTISSNLKLPDNFSFFFLFIETEKSMKMKIARVHLAKQQRQSLVLSLFFFLSLCKWREEKNKKDCCFLVLSPALPSKLGKLLACEFEEGPFLTGEMSHIGAASISPSIPDSALGPNTLPNARTELSRNVIPSPTSELLCYEELDGRKWKYLAETREDKLHGPLRGSIRVVALHGPENPIDNIVAFIRSYVVPEGFPESVAPSYVPYMTWRALKHFFGGAIGVLTTKTLLSSVGASKHTASSGAVAINWVLKDGAGRIGKMLFARQGKKFDHDLKQLRFASDILLELGAGVELATALVPQLFLPLACLANVAKNVAAVTSTATRTPIYKAFTNGENIGDITAKGECISNIADVLGTGLGIMFSKRNPSLVPSFVLITGGYIFCSFQEVRSVILKTLNRSRFSVAVDSFLKTGCVPSVKEGNFKENFSTFSWLRGRHVVLGSSFKDAFEETTSFHAIKPMFERENYMVTYNHVTDNVYALFKIHAKPDDILKAAFHAHVLSHYIQASRTSNETKSDLFSLFDGSSFSKFMSTPSHLEALIAKSCAFVLDSYGIFKEKVNEQGWIMSESLLNHGRARLCLNRDDN